MLVTKRNGSIVSFDPYKIENAIERGLKKIGIVDSSIPKEIAKESAIEIILTGKTIIHVD